MSHFKKHIMGITIDDGCVCVQIDLRDFIKVDLKDDGWMGIGEASQKSASERNVLKD